MSCTTAGCGQAELAGCRLTWLVGWGVSGRWVQGDGVAEGFELSDEVVDLPGGVDPAVVEVGAEVLETGAGVGQQIPDDHENGAGDGDQGLAFAAPFDHPAVAFGQERAVAAGRRGCGHAECALEVGIAFAGLTRGDAGP